MKPFLALLLFSLPAWGQWELGALGGFGFVKNLSVRNQAGSATAGFKSGYAWGFLAGHNGYRHLSGEMRYMFHKGDPKLSSGGTQARFGGHVHLIHADFLLHTSPTGSRIRPFVAFGGGIKVFQGTGTESAAQPLNRFAALTHTREIKPLLSAGAGVKVALTKLLSLRVEARDFVSPPPEKIIAPAPGAAIRGWVHDVTPMAGIVFTF